MQHLLVVDEYGHFYGIGHIRVVIVGSSELDGIIDTDLDAYWNGPLKGLADLPAGYNADPNDKSTMSFRDNFTGFWNVWKYGKVSRNYDLLDEIHPNRIRSAEQWFRREDQLGRELGKGTLWDRVQPENQTIDSVILKGSADLRTGTL